MNPAFSYYGGKCRLAKKILKIVPDHINYVEPFCGSAAVLFKKNLIEPISNYQEIINDYSDYLINFYRQLKTNNEELINKLELTLYSRAEHDLAIEINKNQGKYSELDRAWSFYVNVQQSFASSLDKVWKMSKVKNCSLTWNNKIKNLGNIHERLKQISIENVDALECIKKWDDEATFFYIDPPYINTNCGHYSDYTTEQYKELIYTLNHCKSSFILSSYENEYLPKRWNKEYHEIMITFSPKIKNKSRIEVLSYVDRSKYIKDPKIKKAAMKYGGIIRKV